MSFDFVSARNDPARLERMKPITDRIPDGWGDYLPEVGWDDLLLELDRALAAIDPGYYVFQAKEKFGGLRYYVGHSDDYDGSDEERSKFGALVMYTENISYEICEFCGKAGATRTSGWWKTLCDEHAKGEGK